MESLPTYEEIIALHKKYAPSEEAFDSVFTHSQIVCEIAEQLIKKSNLPVDAGLVKVGCLLHDIGAYKLYLPSGEIDVKNYVKHGTEGHALLEDSGFNEQICRFASRHTGVGLTKKEIEEKSIPIPPQDYFAETLEEKLIMYADKFHTRSTTPSKLMTADAYARFREKFGQETVKSFRNLQKEMGTPELESIAIKYGLDTIT